MNVSMSIVTAKLQPSLTKEAAATAEHAFVTSLLDNSNALLYGLLKCTTYKLQKVQIAAAWTLTGAVNRNHVIPLLHNLHWLPINCGVEYKILILIYKAIHSMTPAYLTDLLTHYTPLCLQCDQHLLFEPQTKLATRGDKAFQQKDPAFF